MDIKAMLNEHGGAPHLNIPTIMFLESVITKDFRILEFGSGSSTLWFANRCKHIISYESEMDWWSAIIDEANNQRINNFDLVYDAKYWETLETGLDENSPFDLILIDGAEHEGAREMCVKKAWKYLAEGGYFVLDDTQRDRYKESVEFIDSFDWYRWCITGRDYWGDEGNHKQAIVWQYKGI